MRVTMVLVVSAEVEGGDSAGNVQKPEASDVLEREDDPVSSLAGLPAWGDSRNPHSINWSIIRSLDRCMG